MFNVFIKNTSTGDIYEVPWESFDFTEELNKDKDARFHLDFDALKDQADAYGTTVSTIIASGLREIWVEKNGTKVYYGVISEYDLSKEKNGHLKINLASFGFMSLFNRRRTSNSKIFSATDAAQIAWTLINESQTADPPFSDFGITQGVLPTTVNRDENYQFANIKDEITSLSNESVKNGFDFEIDNLKKFNVYFPYKGQQRPEIVFDAGNLVSWSSREPLLSTMANKVYVLGDGYNTDITYAYRQSSSDYKSAFKVLEDVISLRNIQSINDLNDAGDQYLSFNQGPIAEYTFVHLDDDPDILSYGLGDTPLVTLPELDLTRVYLRAKKRNIGVDQNGLATITLTLKII